MAAVVVCAGRSSVRGARHRATSVVSCHPHRRALSPGRGSSRLRGLLGITHVQASWPLSPSLSLLAPLSPSSRGSAGLGRDAQVPTAGA